MVSVRQVVISHARHIAYFLWDNADRVWGYSGDTGTSFRKQKGGEWKKYCYVDKDVAAPLFPEEKWPRRHKKRKIRSNALQFNEHIVKTASTNRAGVTRQ